MFVRAHSKQRFGDPKEPFINVDEIISVEVGHDGHSVNVKMSNNEELEVIGDRAKKLLAYLDEHQIK
jgi:hypothetical protein